MLLEPGTDRAHYGNERIAALVRVGLMTVSIDAGGGRQGADASGAQVARQMAMSGEDDVIESLGTVLDAASSPRERDLDRGVARGRVGPGHRR
jgi:hypothetical protein